MGNMKKLVGIFMILALVVTTTMAPSISHAMPHNSAETGQTQTSEKHDCHHHGEAKVASDKTTQNDKGASNKCCDKGMCKCIGGTCHNGLSKIFGNGETLLLAVTASKSQFGFANEFADFALLQGLKRPPRA